MDDDGSKSININEFTKSIHEHTLHWTPLQIKAVFDKFDSDKNGNLSYDEFLRHVRGDMNNRRKEMVSLAFQVKS